MKLAAFAIAIFLSALTTALASAKERCEEVGKADLLFDNGPLLPTIEVRVNGVVRRFLLDTGSDVTMLSARFKNASAGATRSIGGFEGHARLGTAVLDSLVVGPIAERQVAVAVELDDSVVSENWDGILGADYLAKYDLDISYVAGQLVFYRARGCSPGWTERAGRMVLAVGASKIPRTEVKANGAGTVAVVDTGATGSLIRSDYLRVAFPGSPVTPTRNKVAGFGDARSNVGVASVGPVSIGGAQFDKIRMNVIEPQNRRNEDGMVLGGDFFGSHRVFISASTRTLHYLAEGSPDADFSVANRAWQVSLAEKGNINAQVRLMETADSAREHLEWQKIAAGNGHVGSLVALAVRARRAGEPAEAKKYVTLALSNDPENYSALIERFLVTQSQESRNIAAGELAATLQHAKLEPKRWQQDVYELLMGRVNAERFIENIVAAPVSDASKCSISGFLRELRRSGQGWESLKDADLKRMCKIVRN